jgi:endonuclease/exonuclease/phosphatase family metal-dependent hydrolase
MKNQLPSSIKWILFIVTILVSLSLLGAFLQDQAFKVMSFNIRYGTAKDGENTWPNRKEMLFRLIESESPEILGLQEALKFQIDQMVERFPYFAVSGKGRDDGKTQGEYSSILYHSDRFSMIEEDTFWLSETPRIPGSKSWGNSITRICSWIELLDRKDDLRLLVINLHLDHRSQNSREKSVVLVLEKFGEDIKNRPVIIMGDFNAGEDNPAIRKILEFRDESAPDTYLRDSFRVLQPDQQQVGTFNGFRGRKDGPKIDHVFVSRHFLVRSAEIIDYNERGKYPSDHFPVSAVLEVLDPIQ